MEPAQETLTLQSIPPKANVWLQTLLSGFGLYIIAVVFLILIGNPNLFPTVVMIGSFLVPVTYVTFFYERRHLSNLSL